MIGASKVESARPARWPRQPLLFLALALALAPTVRGAETAPTPEGLELFEKKIRQLLVERCYPCHSATSEKLKGGLHLDSREGMLKGGDTRPAVVPGDPKKSLLIEAIGYGNPDLQMPPKKKLADAEISDLVSWVKMGAPWSGGIDKNVSAKAPAFDLEKRRARHWSWKPIQPCQPPSVNEAKWPATAVDQFILAKLEQNNLAPAPAADKRTLIRRAYFDLIGLPPAPSEVEAFLSDSAPSAFDRVVDRLLASPQFGERWARHWLDLVRYAETLGHEFDYANFNAWRYRDYVIRAFNADLPYDQFVTEQIAGDLLEKPRRNPTAGFNESVIGTGFYWLGQRAHSPVDVRLEQAEVVDSQIDVLAKTFLGLTVACARCHDHKFDAISTRDYYALFGVLSSSRYAQRSIDPPETLAEQVQALRSLKWALRPLLAAVWLGQATNVAAYLVAAREVASGVPDHASLGSSRDSPQPTLTPARSHLMGAGWGEGPHVTQTTNLSASNRVLAVASARQLDPARLERWARALEDQQITQPVHPLFAWARLAGATNQPTAALLNPSAAETFGDFSGNDFSGWSVEDEAFGTSPAPAGDFVVGDLKRPVLCLLPEPAANSASVSRRLEGVLRSPTFTIQKRYAHLLAAGSNSRLNVRVDDFTMIRDPIYGGLKRALDNESLQWITVDLDTWKGHRAYLEFNDLTTPDPSDEADKRFSELAYVAVSRAVFSDDPAPPIYSARSLIPSLDGLAKVNSLEQLAQLYQHAAIAAVEAWRTERFNDDVAAAQIAWLDWLIRNSLLDGASAKDPAARQLATVLEKFRKLEDAIPERARALGTIDGTGLDENVFIRGSHKTLGDKVPRRFLEALGGSETTRFHCGSGRLELAQRITDPSNPFLARVMVNRVWQHLFGRGIVATPDDFGALGQPPTHPEVLDWLANWYRTEGGWSTKKLIRLLVTSSTYRMASRPADLIAEEKDPQDLLLHRMPVRRLESEAIRDAILAVSGRLEPTMFGKPVPMYLTEFMEGRGRPAQSGPIDGAGRRSIYQEVRRNFPSPMMRAFDFPVPFSTIGRRTVSNVPAQSLILMNDPFVIGQAQAWAESSLAKPGLSPEQRIGLMYETILSRPPRPAELAEALAFLERQGDAYGPAPAPRLGNPALWADLCHVLMNVKEFVFLN